MLADKKDEPYSMVMSWLRCRVGFALVRSSVMCLRGAQSSIGHPVNESLNSQDYCQDVDCSIQLTPKGMYVVLKSLCYCY